MILLKLLKKKQFYQFLDNYKIKQTIDFDDHHIYTEEELLEMEEEYDDEDEENKWDEDIDYEQYDEYYD